MEWVALGVLDEGGAPFGIAAPAVVFGEQLYFAVPAGSPALQGLERDPRCCCSADVFPSYYEIRGATMHGRACREEPHRGVAAALEERARAHGLAGEVVYALPLLEDAFGFDFGKLERR